MALALLASAALTGGLRTWGPSHVGISQQALLLLPDQIKTAFNSTHIHFLGEDGTAESFFGKPFSESGDTVAGPCAANKTTPCSPAAVEAKVRSSDSLLLIPNVDSARRPCTAGLSLTVASRGGVSAPDDLPRLLLCRGQGRTLC
jgi:hypothetical protein